MCFRKKIFVILPILIIAIYSSSSSQIRKSYKVERITTGELKALIDNKEKVTIIDVRSKEEYDEAHIPNSISTPLIDLHRYIRFLSKEKLIVAY